MGAKCDIGVIEKRLELCRITVMAIKVAVDVSKWWVLLEKRHGLETGGECYSKVKHLSTGRLW